MKFSSFPRREKCLYEVGQLEELWIVVNLNRLVNP